MSMTGDQNHDDGGVAPWSDLNHDLLISVIMKLGFIDIFAFGGVCKSWRSLALPNRKKFMASKPPMSISRPPLLKRISTDANEKEKEFSLTDFKGRKFKTLLPHSGGRRCVGVTCGGYLILFGSETKDFWLVNPITRHEIHFPDFPCAVHYFVRATLVFSPAIHGWVLVVIYRHNKAILFSTAHTGTWNRVVSESRIHDLIAFKGKMYTLSTDWRLYEMRLDPNPNLTFLTNEYYQKPPNSYPIFASSGEKLYVTDNNRLKDPYVCELDLGKMKLVLPEEKTIREYLFFLGYLEHVVVIKPESWSQHKRYDCFPETDIATTDIRREGSFFSTSMWYFPHLCLDVDILHE